MFPITVSLTITNPEQLAKVLAGITATPAATPCQGHAKEAAKEEAKEEAKAEAKKPASALAEKPAASQATAEEPAAATPKAETSGDKVYTVDDAKALTMKIVADKGRDAAVGLLKSYDVPVAAKLPADKIEAFCRDAEKVLTS